MQPGQVWFVDFDPVRGREQGRNRPALVVSSRFHLDLTMGHLICVLPLTSVERPGWVHRVRVASDVLAECRWRAQVFEHPLAHLRVDRVGGGRLVSHGTL